MQFFGQESVQGRKQATEVMIALYDELAPSLAVRIVPTRLVLYQDPRYKVVWFLESPSVTPIFASLLN